MKKVYAGRHTYKHKTLRHRKKLRKSSRKQRGGDLTANLVSKRGIIDEYLLTVENVVTAHGNFPRKNALNQFVMVFTSADNRQHPILVIKMEKQGAGFVNVTVETMYDHEADVMALMAAYPTELPHGDPDSTAISHALDAAFPGTGLAY